MTTMRPWLISSAASVTMLAASAALAQNAPPSIRGRVLAAENRRALPRARIVISGDGSQIESVLADDNGGFSLPLASAARPAPVVSGVSRTVVLVVSKAGYAVQHVLAPPATKELTIALVRAVAISGRVADVNGEGAVDVRVVAQRQDAAPPDRDLTPTRFETTTDDRGEYRLGGLPAGRYEVGMEGAAEPARIELRSGDEIGAINFLRVESDPIPVAPGSASPAVPPPGQEGTGAISGRVLSASGRPLAAARVRALRNGLTPRGAVADRQGRFTIAQLPAGPYTLDASRNGYVTAQYGQERASQPGTQVLVRERETAANLDIRLPRGTAVTGTIVDEQGEPVQGVSVRAMQLRYAGGRTAALNVGPRQFTTDDRGHYRVHGLLPGAYLVVASSPATIAGASGRGYAPVFYPGTTQASEASAITADLGRDVSAVDFVMTPTIAARVAGVVRTSDGTPFAGAVLMMASARSGSIAVEPQRPAQAPDGSFVFSNVPPGDYVLQAMRVREGNRGFAEFGAEFITVVDGDPKPVVVNTRPGATLTGRLVHEWEGTARQPRPEDAPSFMPLPTDYDRAPAIGGGASAWSVGRDGSFSVSGLFGPTRFRLMGREDEWYVKSISIGGLDVTDAPFDFGNGQQTVTGAEVVISNAGAGIGGHVTDASSAPVNSYSVVVFSTDRSKWFVTSRFLRLARPTQDGSFEVTGLPPGEYWVAATDPLEGNDVSGDWLKPETLERLAFRATRVTLMERERFMTVLRVIRASR